MGKEFTHNKAKFLTALMLLAVMVLGTSCSLFTHRAADLYGLWESTQNANYHYLVYIDAKQTDIFMYEDEAEEMLLNTWSGTYTTPADGFSTYTWTAEQDADRSDSGYARPLQASSVEFEYKSGNIYIHTTVGTIELAKSNESDHPACMKMIENNSRCSETIPSAQPLEYQNVLLFNTADGEWLCMAEITNPNSFGVKPEFRFSDGNTYVWPTPAYIPAGGTSVYVGILHYGSADYVPNPENESCSIGYNIYSSEFDMTYPVISVADSEVVHESTGLVSDVVVNLDIDQLPAPTVYGDNAVYPDFSLYVIFYNGDDIVGAGTGLANYGTYDEPEVSWHISEVSTYDRYEVYAGTVLMKSI